MTESELFAQVRGARTTVDLAGALLRFCCGGGRFQEYRTFRDSASGRKAEAGLQQAVERIFDARAADTVSGSQRSELLATLERSTTALLVTRVRAAAVALDRTMGTRFSMVLRDPPLVRELSPGDPIPAMPPARKKEIVGDLISALPESLNDRIDWLPHLRLVPPLQGDLSVVLDCRYLDQLEAVLTADRQSIAAGLPNAALRDLTWDKAPADGTFFGVRPVSPLEQQERLFRLLDSADAHEVSILVLPELCAQSGGLDALINRFQQHSSNIRLLVAGSAHLEDSTGRRNRSLVAVRGSPTVAVHDKFSEYSYQDEQCGCRLYEDICRTPKQVHVMMSASWSLVVLVCKDFLDMNVRHLLAELGVALILVPSFSERTEEFSSFAGSAAMNAQAFVAIANNPSLACDDPKGEQRYSAIFAFPRRVNPLVRVVRRGSHHPMPGVCATQPNSQVVQWFS